MIYSKYLRSVFGLRQGLHWPLSAGNSPPERLKLPAAFEGILYFRLGCLPFPRIEYIAGLVVKNYSALLCFNFDTPKNGKFKMSTIFYSETLRKEKAIILKAMQEPTNRLKEYANAAANDFTHMTKEEREHRNSYYEHSEQLLTPKKQNKLGYRFRKRTDYNKGFQFFPAGFTHFFYTFGEIIKNQ
ncbi:uncharacterized protein EV154DRAFT_488718 [Mucor mucedo]|uniref:uncharacterized protein n=1 Tax=Mucor mucedo TaxID=29922 RepID=UPI002220EA24|nr:uncharacterized protein EV154DRAFT_488718 [Mucor mucedo]KAI7865391.1 hypothetical protein EV154DRAFT_488718 [Mucor mucedo]